MIITNYDFRSSSTNYYYFISLRRFYSIRLRQLLLLLVVVVVVFILQSSSTVSSFRIVSRSPLSLKSKQFVITTTRFRSSSSSLISLLLQSPSSSKSSTTTAFSFVRNDHKDTDPYVTTTTTTTTTRIPSPPFIVLLPIRKGKDDNTPFSLCDNVSTSPIIQHHHHQQQQQSSLSSVSYVPIQPSRIQFNNSVTYQYPKDWTRKLFSSVPYREYALREINLQFGPNEITLLVGSSSCGKSTVLQLIILGSSSNNNKMKSTTQLLLQSGDIYVGPWDKTNCATTTNTTSYLLSTTTTTTKNIINESNNHQQQQQDRILQQYISKPIYLDRKPSYSADYRTVYEIVQSDMDQYYTNNKKLTTTKRPTANSIQQQVRRDVLEAIYEYLLYTIFHLSNVRRGCDLSPSEVYRFQLLRSCIDSMIYQAECHQAECQPNVAPTNEPPTSTTLLSLSGPILLFDEWFDKETRDVIYPIQLALQRLVTMVGAVCCIVTHKPERFHRPKYNNNNNFNNNNDDNGTITTQCRLRQITLSSGKVLSDTYIV